MTRNYETVDADGHILSHSRCGMITSTPRSANADRSLLLTKTARND